LTEFNQIVLTFGRFVKSFLNFLSILYLEINLTMKNPAQPDR